MRYRHAVLFLILCALGSGPALSQQIYLRNHTFKGKTSGLGKDLQVSLKDMAGAMSLEVKPSGSGWVVGTPPAGEGEVKGVWVNGTEVEAHEENGEEFVNLEAFAQAAGLHYQYNKALDTIDISVDTAAKKQNGSSSAGQPNLSGAPGTAIEVNPGHPGQVVNIDGLAEAGKLTLVFVYRNGYKDDGYRSIVRKIDVLANNPSVILYKVNMDYAGSPGFQACPSLPNASPILILFARNRNLQGSFGGHSILSVIANPDAFFKEQLERSKRLWEPHPVNR